MADDVTADAAAAETTAPAPASPAPAPASGPPASPSTAPKQTDTADAGDDGLDLDAVDEPAAPAAEGEQGEKSEEEAEPALWPQRPEDLDASDEKALAEWKAEVGLPGRDAYARPELAEGLAYTEFGSQLADKILDLGYRLDLPPEAAQKLILNGNEIIREITKSRDAEHNRAGSKALIEEFGGNRDAAKAHVASARAALTEHLPEGLGQILLEARGADGRKLTHTPEFLRWAAQLGATLAAPAASQKEIRQMTIQKELDELDIAMRQDVSSMFRPWKATGQLATDYKLSLMRELEGTAPQKPSESEIQSELRELADLKARDPDSYRFGGWKGHRSASERHAQLLRRRG